MFTRLQRSEKRWRGAAFITLLASLLVVALRLLGFFELLEWKALDLFFIHRLSTDKNAEIVLVTITEDDIQYLQEYPLSDEVLTKLLRKIKQQKPTVIGLDIFRDFAVASKANNPEQNRLAYAKLQELFRSTPNLIGIAKITDSEAYPSVNSSSTLKQLGQLAAADQIVDDDGVVRRGNLFPVTDGSAISSTPSLGLAVALNYLKIKNIKPLSTKDGWLKLKNSVFLPFESNNGGYIRADDKGYQILLNWRSCNPEYFTKVTVKEILQQQVSEDLFRERIVLIGNQAISVKDNFATPCSQGTGSTPNTMAGVEIHAHVASQIIANVLHGQPILKIWSEPIEYLWFVFWIATVSIFGWKQQKYDNPWRIFLSLLILTAIEIAILIAVSYLLFATGWWTPIIPTLFGIGLTAVMVVGSVYIIQLLKVNKSLEDRVAVRTQKLEQALEKLHQSQQQLIVKEKQIALGTLSARVAHQIRNPLSLIDVNIASCHRLVEQLEQIIEENELIFGDIIYEMFQSNEHILSSLEENIKDSRKQIIRINRIIESILSYSRQEQIDFSFTPLNNLIAKTLLLVAEQHKDSTIKLITNYDNLIGAIEIVPLEIEKALINLLENAYFAVQSKQKKSEHYYTPTITVETLDLADKVEIVISDNGEGIAQELISRIFEPFWTTKSAFKGTGLGLFFVYQIIVKMHKGKIAVRSIVGEYTEFRIELFKVLQVT